jgi:hypothetical protein
MTTINDQNDQREFRALSDAELDAVSGGARAEPSPEPEPLPIPVPDPLPRPGDML